MADDEDPRMAWGPGEWNAEVERLADQLRLARESLAYVVEHHIVHDEDCLCPAARSVAEAGLRLTAEVADG